MGAEKYIKALVDYGIRTGLIDEGERIYSTNLILDVMDLDEYDITQSAVEIRSYSASGDELESILKGLVDDAVSRGVTQDDTVSRDLFDTRLMNCITPRPSYVRKRFEELYASSPIQATDWYYKFSCDTDYIRRYRIKKRRKVGNCHSIRRSGHHDQPVKAREGSEGHCCGKERTSVCISQVPALR